MCHVLIIEDEVLVAMLIEDTLADAGATSFDIAATENEAVNAAMLRPPAFITVDMSLKLGHGDRALNRIRAELGQVPAVVMTGDLEPTRPDGDPCRVLRKPFRVDELAQAFERADLI